ncbi:MULTISPECIES: single-stranded DNA-binding protein [Thermoactinomyces]|jgi:single-strand DNA-binding protein|uniref:Single-stranded DNA-binding protein n=1 Tax=Thermoactinomyces vulgaris TaxID=2026 RepID=A0ABS0QFK2_THEVU|nr:MULTISPECIES: single-stranded DNA-binding protein [Thermoactinomyces]KFZ39389.1 single-stranded DNA-binding protein [Thermoactinomyces sp. Gus2-1]KYQ86110.1 single-stranded DNA-binding protein [Thermoactinomyces sp. AS95]MBA4551140.1 single-stranded DNA-binding protein [Thermoactinomyces vulgaris]MBA4596901.1 single-stranded DNA-binding protein [Thermoactinomyces vulgaris]MBH8583683.1 single-stranded DNA-binding protein [Thermoactinomyces sp. CICC 10735]
MINRVILVGRLTRDPELRYTPSGIAVVRFNVAVNRNYLNQRGEREADFINIVAWRNLAENCANYLRKGSLVGIDGRLQTGKYENQEGRTVYTTDVVAEDVRFLEPRNRNAESGGAFGASDNSRNGNSYSQNTPLDDPFADDGQPIDISDDDLPF